jgi:hypothetical protein
MIGKQVSHYKILSKLGEGGNLSRRPHGRVNHDR